MRDVTSPSSFTMLGWSRRRRTSISSRHEPHALRLQIVEPHLLQSHQLARLQVPSFVHVAVRPLANLLPPTSSKRGLRSWRYKVLTAADKRPDCSPLQACLVFIKMLLRRPHAFCKHSSL